MAIGNVLNFEKFNAISHWVTQRPWNCRKMFRSHIEITHSRRIHSLPWQPTLSWFEAANTIEGCRNPNTGTNITSQSNWHTSCSHKSSISTTAASTTSLLVIRISGSAPYKISWMNWHRYLREVSSNQWNGSSLKEWNNAVTVLGSSRISHCAPDGRKHFNLRKLFLNWHGNTVQEGQLMFMSTLYCFFSFSIFLFCKLQCLFKHLLSRQTQVPTNSLTSISKEMEKLHWSQSAW